MSRRPSLFDCFFLAIPLFAVRTYRNPRRPQRPSEKRASLTACELLEITDRGYAHYDSAGREECHVLNWQFTGALSACLLFAAASASADDEDHLHVCPLISAELLQKIVPLVKGHACSVHCKGCGCKGGPGYRASDGQCVGYEDLISNAGHRRMLAVTENARRSQRDAFSVGSGSRRKPLPLDLR